MAVKIRLARFGCRNRPFYRVVAADSKSRRDGKQLEVLGYYDPLSGKDGDKEMGFKLDRIKYKIRSLMSMTYFLTLDKVEKIRLDGVSWRGLYIRMHSLKRLVRYWLSVGAQPSDAAQYILFRAGVLPPSPVLATDHKGGPHGTLPIDSLSGCFDQPENTTGNENDANEDTQNASNPSNNSFLLCNIGFPVPATDFNENGNL